MGKLSQDELDRMDALIHFGILGMHWGTRRGGGSRGGSKASAILKKKVKDLHLDNKDVQMALGLFAAAGAVKVATLVATRQLEKHWAAKSAEAIMENFLRK